MSGNTLLRSVKHVFIGRARELTEHGLFHKLSLVAILAWVGLGADGLSSSCYGPEETYKVLHAHPPLALFVAAMSALTIALICASYAQIIALFPTGGGGYVVASRLLSPAAGVVSGCALLVDYVLTIAISVASAMDAMFSFLPAAWLGWKLAAGLSGVGVLTLLNLRGVRESVMIWVPVFFLFLITHAFAIGYALSVHAGELGMLAHDTTHAVGTVSAEVGVVGLLALLMRAYSMGAGTYTGIEAVSNGLPILREPRVRTGRRAMLLMALSLGGVAAGLLVAYLLVRVTPVEGKTLNAVLLEQLSLGWPAWLGGLFVKISLCSTAALLFIAAQTGFLDGPRVLASMALDRWMPTRFASLSDRFVALNGVLLMGGAALVVLLLTRGSVELLMVLYSINVFATFSLSQLGMVRHWWQVRREEKSWRGRLAINALGLALTSFVLVTLVALKFHEGGWVTVLITTALVAAAFAVRRHYDGVRRQIVQLDEILAVAQNTKIVSDELVPSANPKSSRTAVVFVNGFNGLGLHTLLGAVKMYGGGFRRFVFVHIGVVDAGNFKGADEIQRLQDHARNEAERYVHFVRQRGGEAEAVSVIGHEIIGELEKLLPDLTQRFPDAVFFGGQLVFERETIFTRWLHNHTAFSLQRRLFLRGLACAVVPIRVPEATPTA